MALSKAFTLGWIALKRLNQNNKPLNLIYSKFSKNMAPVQIIKVKNRPGENTQAIFLKAGKSA